MALGLACIIGLSSVIPTMSAILPGQTMAPSHVFGQHIPYLSQDDSEINHRWLVNTLGHSIYTLAGPSAP